jgi:hypothetical protein
VTTDPTVRRAFIHGSLTVALALLDDVSDDLKETRQSFEEKLRRTAKI